MTEDEMVGWHYRLNGHEFEQIDGETVETVSDFILGGSKISAEGDCSHEIIFVCFGCAESSLPCASFL